MNKVTALQAFAVIAIIVGMVISYIPPADNARELWALVSMYLGYVVRDLCGPMDGPQDPKE